PTGWPPGCWECEDPPCSGHGVATRGPYRDRLQACRQGSAPEQGDHLLLAEVARVDGVPQQVGERDQRGVAVAAGGGQEVADQVPVALDAQALACGQQLGGVVPELADPDAPHAHLLRGGRGAADGVTTKWSVGSQDTTRADGRILRPSWPLATSRCASWAP